MDKILAVSEANPLVFVRFKEGWPTREHSKEELKAYKQRKIDPKKERKVAWLEAHRGPFLNEGGTKRTAKALEVGEIGISTQKAFDQLEADHPGCFEIVEEKAYKAWQSKLAKERAREAGHGG